MCDVIQKYCQCRSYSISLHNPIGVLPVSLILFEKIFCPNCISDEIRFGETESGRKIPTHAVFSKRANGYFGILYNEWYVHKEAPEYLKLDRNPGKHLALDGYGFNGEADGESKHRFWTRVISISPEKEEKLQELPVVNSH